MIRDALVSPCERYRYTLYRRWSPHQPMVVWVMLNPSKADATKDDATVRTCIRLSLAWSFGGLVVVNLFALRSTDPGMLAADHEPVGPENDLMIERECTGDRVIVAAWGAHPFARARAKTVCDALIARRRCLFCIGLTQEGFPRHPLYSPKTTMPKLWRTPEVAA